MIASASITLTKISDGLTTFYEYAQNSSNTTAPVSGWGETVPVAATGKFIWRREGSALTKAEVTSWKIVCLTGAKGDKGSAGSKGDKGDRGEAGSFPVIQYAIGSWDQPPSTVIIGEESWGLGHDYWIAGQNFWESTVKYTSNPDDYVWMRVAQYDPVEDTYSEWSYTRLSGVQGEQGPHGKIGQLGIIAEGITLHIKGFGEDGYLTEDEGIIYTSEDMYLVEAYSEELTANGQGYVVFDGTTISYAKLRADNNSKRWTKYNEDITIPDGLWVIGKFFKQGENIYDMSMLTPEPMATFEITNFMDILKSGDIENINVWANANGVGTVFSKLAILDAFIDELFANVAKIKEIFAREIEMSKEGSIKSEGFVSGQSKAGFRISGSGVAEFVDAIIQGAVTADTVTADSLQTFKEQLSTQIVNIDNQKSAWNIPNTFSTLFPQYPKQPEEMVIVGAGSTYKGKPVSKVGVSVNSNTTLLYKDGTRSRGFKDNSATWLSYTLNEDLLGSAYKEGQIYRITVSTSFGGDWADQTIEQWRGGVEIKRLGSGRNTSLSVDAEVMAGDTIKFWGKNSAWPIFGTKTMYVYAFSVHSVKAGTAPHIAEYAPFSNVSKSNSGSSWVSQDFGSPITIPLGARNLRLRYSSYSIASGTSMGTHYYIRAIINGIEQTTNYTLGDRYTNDIPVSEGDSVQFRLYVAPTFSVTTYSYDDDGNPYNPVTTAYTPSITIYTPRITLVGESTKGLMIIYSDNTSDFIPYAGLNNSEYTEHILDLKSSSEFPHNISPILSKYTLSAIKEEFETSGFSNGSVITCAVDARPILNVNSVAYTVNRIFIYANHLLFNTTDGDIYIYDFASNRAVYDILTISLVTPVSQKGENRTKHITPLENLKYSIGDRVQGLLFDLVSSRMGDFDTVHVVGDVVAGRVYGAVAN